MVPQLCLKYWKLLCVHSQNKYHKTIFLSTKIVPDIYSTDYSILLYISELPKSGVLINEGGHKCLAIEIAMVSTKI